MLDAAAPQPIRDPDALRERLAMLRPAGPTDALDVAARRQRLDALSDVLRARRDDVIAAIGADFGHRPEMEILTGDLGYTLDAIAHIRRRTARWARPRRRTVMRPVPGRSEVVPEPKGVVGIVSPWNYPLQLALVPLATAVAAGNRAMLKPSERSPRTSDLLAEIVAAALPASEAAVALGDAEMGRAFCALPFDHLFYTGNAAVARSVMRAAADNLTPVTLELGGRSPAILMPDADPATHGRAVAWGKWYGAGQTCVACDHAWVPRGTAAAWGDALLEAGKGFLAEHRASDYSGLIDARHRARVEAMVEEARAAGAVIHAADLPPRPDHAYRPTVVLNAPADCALMREEVFGPVLPVIEYDDPADVVRAVNGGEAPLAAYAFGRDVAAARALLGRIRSGGGAVNLPVLHLAVHDAPFGGVGTSGMGAYHGERGFRELSHERAVFTPFGGMAAKLLAPPYSGAARRMVRWMAR